MTYYKQIFIERGYNMLEFSYKITDDLGIHARPAGIIVKTAKEFESEITMVKEKKEANMKMIFSLMGLGVKKDDEVKVIINGSDEEVAKNKLESLIKEIL